MKEIMPSGLERSPNDLDAVAGRFLGSSVLGAGVTSTPEVSGGDTHTQWLSPQRLGLSPVDYEKAMRNDEAKKIIIQDGEVTKKVPVLVPAKDLYWFNMDYLEKVYNTDNIFYFTHPRVDFNRHDEAQEAVTDVLEKGGVIIYDVATVNGKEVGGDVGKYFKRATDYQVSQLGSDKSRHLDQYTGPIIYNIQEVVEYKSAPTFYEKYKQAKEEGVINEDPENGTSIADAIEGEEASRLWNIYEAPFARLSENSPLKAGYDRDTFFEVLKDPAVTKVINREEGIMTSLALFVGDLKHCPWLDEDHYLQNYPDVMRTNNLLVFTGIVSDEKYQGKTYSLALMDLLIRVGALRETSFLLSFECTAVSTKYIPRLVKYGTLKTGLAKAEGLDAPVSQLRHYAITSRSAT